jgi:hypothetical protein
VILAQISPRHRIAEIINHAAGASERSIFGRLAKDQANNRQRRSKIGARYLSGLHHQ